MAEKVTINIIAQTQQAGQKMRELGEKITGIGMRISAAFTLPLVGLFAALQKNEAFAAAFKPIQDAFAGIFNQFATGLIPILNELKPALIGLAVQVGGMLRSFIPSIIALIPTIKDLLGYVSQAVTWFSNLSAPTKDAIVKFIAFGAILGPVLIGFGQFIWLGGTIIGLLPDLAKFLWTTVAPVVALAAAIFALIKLVQMDEFKQLVSLLAGGFVTTMTGNDTKKGALATAKTYAALGGGQAGGADTGDFVRGIFGGVTAPTGGAGNVTQVVYAPTLSTASEQELMKALGPIIADVNRQQPGR